MAHDLDPPEQPVAGRQPTGVPPVEPPPVRRQVRGGRRDRWRLIERIGERGGVAHLDEFARIDHRTPRAIREHLGREGWRSPYPNVFVLPGLPFDHLVWAQAAYLHVVRSPFQPRPAAVSGVSALALAGLTRVAPTAVQLVAGPSVSQRRSQRLVVRRVTWLDGPAARSPLRPLVGTDQLVPAGGSPSSPGRWPRAAAVTAAWHGAARVVSGPALLRSLVPLRGPEVLIGDAIDLIRIGNLDLGALRAHLDLHPVFPGRRMLEHVLVTLAPVGRVDSVFELSARTAFRDVGITFDPGQVRVPTTGGSVQHLDLGVRSLRFGIELDSWRHHHQRADLERDARRANLRARLDEDWRVVHLTWSALHDDWSRTVRLVEDVMIEQARRFGADLSPWLSGRPGLPPVGRST